jgi:hypothetical protein
LTVAWGNQKEKWEKGDRAGARSAAEVSRDGGVPPVVEYSVSERGSKMTSANAAPQTVYVTLTGLPLWIQLAWPLHRSTSADFWVLHADVRLVGAEGMHAPVAVNMSATVREVFPSLEQKDTEGPIINAVRKEVDRRQLEFVKSGKLVPVHFSSRHYDFKRKQWAFGKADEATVRTLLERKIYWQTKAAGGDVWIVDEIEAQYLQTTTEHLAQVANAMAGEGLVKLERRWATALPSLMARAEKFESAMRIGLEELEKKHAFERG